MACEFGVAAERQVTARRHPPEFADIEKEPQRVKILPSRGVFWSTRGMTTKLVRYGVIGTGMMGIEHIENITALDGATVTAISDTNSAQRDAGLAAAPEAEIFVDHRDLLASGLVDAVVVATPNFTHASIMADVLAAEVHVLIEKPLCTTVSDCQELIALANASAKDRVVWVGLEYRYMPPVAKLIEAVTGGAVGTPRMVSITEHRFPFLVKVDDWNRFSENTGGTLVEKCCHFFNLMDILMGERPIRVMASGAQDVNHLDEVYDGRVPDVLDNAFVIVEYPSGGRAMLDLCMFAEATQNQEEISVIGERGKVEALIPDNELRIGTRGTHSFGQVEKRSVHDDSIQHEGLHHGASYLEHVRFCEAIRGEREVDSTLDDGLWSVAVGAAAHLSIDEGRVVEIVEVLK